MRRGTRFAIAMVIAIAAMALVPGLASAHTKRWASRTSIDAFFYGPVIGGVVFGEVKSPKPRCVPNRKVKVFRQTPSGWSFHDSTTSHSHPDYRGEWELLIEQPGTYRATVVRKNLGPRGHRHICKAFTSAAAST